MFEPKELPKGKVYLCETKKSIEKTHHFDSIETNKTQQYNNSLRISQRHHNILNIFDEFMSLLKSGQVYSIYLKIFGQLNQNFD